MSGELVGHIEQLVGGFLLYGLWWVMRRYGEGCDDDALQEMCDQEMAAGRSSGGRSRDDILRELVPKCRTLDEQSEQSWYVYAPFILGCLGLIACMADRLLNLPDVRTALAVFSVIELVEGAIGAYKHHITYS